MLHFHTQGSKIFVGPVITQKETCALGFWQIWCIAAHDRWALWLLWRVQTSFVKQCVSKSPHCLRSLNDWMFVLVDWKAQRSEQHMTWHHTQTCINTHAHTTWGHNQYTDYYSLPVMSWLCGCRQELSIGLESCNSKKQHERVLVNGAIDSIKAFCVRMQPI